MSSNNETATVKTKKLTLATAKKMAKNYRGVSVVSKLLGTKPFKAKLTHETVTHFLGHYADAKEAALAYNKKAKTIFKGEKNAKNKNRWNVVE